MTSFRVIGKPAVRVEGTEKVTGQAKYSADISLEGVLWGKCLHSPHTHAGIVHLDATKARTVPGVHAVITGADVGLGLYGRFIKDIPVLARSRVRFFGERVAAVAAEDEDTALRALDLIEIEYDELPAVFDPLEALQPGAPILHPEYSSYPGVRDVIEQSNGFARTLSERGDLDAGFRAAHVIVENSFRTQRVHQAYLEPQSVLVAIANGRVQVWTGSKTPYNAREALAAAAGISEQSIVLNPVLIGGDFGGKGTPCDLPVCYFLAKESGRPVRMVLDYIEEFMAGDPRHEVLIRLKTGATKEGILTAHQVEYIVNCGAYAGHKPRGTISAAAQAMGPYRIPNTRTESVQVYTNTVHGGYMRAPGEPQAVFALESQLDDVARQLRIDPLEFRLKNLIRDGEEAANGERLDHVRAIEAMSLAAEAADYHSQKAPFVGRGIAIGDRGPGGGQGNASILLRPDGSILLKTPVFDQGTGTYTTLCQVVAEEFGVPIKSVQLEVWNTDSVSFDSGIAGSRGTRVNSTAAFQAAQAAKLQLFHIAAALLSWPEDHLAISGLELRRIDTGEKIRWPDLLERAGETVEGKAHIEESGRAHVTSFAAQVAEVSIDLETGEVKLLRFTTAHDVGRIINPVGHQGQINGAVMQGIGYALMEELQVEGGRVMNLSFGDYKIPTIRDAPPLKTVLLESENGVGSYQTRGIGEGPTIPVAAAIANAITDAIGVRFHDLPITSEKVFRALQESRVQKASMDAPD
ncbi:MAG: molybdopterin-dependent oxidoreductase [Dehalococcoidia bacterium]|nr:molybdopterin-dependent oxidoreductase [Dehalococcoidia bacterium]